MAKMKLKKKDKFSALEDDFKDEVVAMDKPSIDKKIADWAKLIETTGEAMKNDGVLAAKREAARLAYAPYYEDIKMAKLRITFAMRVLNDRGTK